MMVVKLMVLSSTGGQNLWATLDEQDNVAKSWKYDN